MHAKDLDTTFAVLITATIFSSLLAGSTFQLVIHRGIFLHASFRDNQYNIIVAIAALTSLIQTVTCFVNVLIAPNHAFGFSVYIVVNWIFMTHSSVLLVSRKLSLTYLCSDLAWRRLLWINYIMLPFSIFICVSWTASHNFSCGILTRINRITEPVQIALWGLIEFCLSGAFIVKMWKFKWTSVERPGIIVLVMVAILDILSILMNLFIGDLESTCVKGFVYSLRVRLEVGVLCSMVSFIKSKRGSVTYGSSPSSTGPSNSFLNTLKTRNSRSSVRDSAGTLTTIPKTTNLSSLEQGHKMSEPIRDTDGTIVDEQCAQSECTASWNEHESSSPQQSEDNGDCNDNISRGKLQQQVSQLEYTRATLSEEEEQFGSLVRGTSTQVLEDSEEMLVFCEEMNDEESRIEYYLKHNLEIPEPEIVDCSCHAAPIEERQKGSVTVAQQASSPSHEDQVPT